MSGPGRVEASAGLRDPRICYALSVLLDREPSEPDAWPDWITYGAASPEVGRPAVHIISSGLFGEKYGRMDGLPALPLAEISGVPLLFGTPCVERRADVLVVHADIIASAFFLLTRYEEWVRRDVRDEHGRFPGKESLPSRGGFLHRPLVDEYAALLRQWASGVGIEIPVPKRRFSVLLTHDVDSLGPAKGLGFAARSLLGGLSGRSPLGQALSQAAVNIGMHRHSCDNLGEVIKLDRRLTGRFPEERCRSMFFFMAGGKSAFDGDCHIHDARTLRRLRDVSAAGAAIGLHTSYSAGVDPALVRGERRTLETITGLSIEKNRHHFLTWREPEHGEAIADAGIRWDASLGYADEAGFRLGVCHPVPLFDPIRQCLIGVEEHPLVVMDCTLSMVKYMNLSEEAAFDCIRTLVDATFRYQGEVVCLWHNTVLAASDTGYHKRLYPHMLDYLASLLEMA